MPTISIHFTGGHYHATPWDRAQNEGAVEWPPSPWRLLRGLIAAGYAKLPAWQDGIMPDTAHTLISKLASTLPAYRLPLAGGAHTRHYIPLRYRPFEEEKGKALVLDARAVPGVNHKPLLVRWNVELELAEHTLLGELASALGYIGRAESWCEAELVDDYDTADEWCLPSDEAKAVDGETVRLMATLTPADYTAWHETELAAAKDKKTQAAIPADLIAALQCETGTLQQQGWTQPPGSRMVLYVRPIRNAIGVTRPRPAPTLPLPHVPFTLLALASTARSRSALPLRTRTLPQAELLHRSIASYIGRLVGSERDTAARELLGIGAAEGHRHAHIMPLSLIKNDKHLDHMLLWAPDGLSGVSQSILRRIRATYMKGGVGELAVRFVGSGSAADLDGFAYLRPITATACVWQSLTPLVLPRYRKKSGKNTPEGQIIAELASRNLPAPVEIEVLPDESLNMRHFVRRRRNRQPPEDYGYAIRLTFAEPVTGPLALGHSSHFGLGLFAAVE